MAGSCEHNQITLQRLKEERFDDPTVFRAGPRVAPRKDIPLKKNKLGFEYTEHGYIGDTITLKLPNNESSVGALYLFTLPNGLSVTYGQINGLAGNFYGTTYPISDGITTEDHHSRFLAAFEILAENRARQPSEAQKILTILQEEVIAINNTLEEGIDPSQVYNKLPDITADFQLITLLRPKDQPSYIGLARINWDHFSTDARTTYNAGHAVALQFATKGTDPENLLIVYTINTFADHFLEDSFAAGHLRTPRRQLHSISGDADLYTKYIYDEDNAIGLEVTSPQGSPSWRMFGDKRLLDTVDKTNRNQATKAVQASADEIFQA